VKANLPPAPEPNPNPQPVPPAPEPVVPVSAPWRRNWQWWLVGAGVLALLAAGAGVGIWWWKREKPPEPPLLTGITDPEVVEALEKSRALVLADPRSADAWGNYGTVLLAHLFDREATQCFIEAERLNPKDPRWPFARGQVAIKRDPPNGLVLLGTAAELARDRPEYRMPFTLAYAEALLEAGQIDRAAELFQSELARDPGAERALYGAGLVAVARGDDTSAARHFEAARHHPSCRKQAAAQLALLARARGDIPAAKQFEAEANALEADPPWPDPYLDRVVTLQVGQRGHQRRVAILERDGNYEGAVEAFREMARQKRTSYALAGEGVNLARIGKAKNDPRYYDQALPLLCEAVQLEPADSRARYTLALILFLRAERQWVADPLSVDAANGFREVVAEAKRATELKPDDAQAYRLWGLAKKNLGEPKDGIEPLRTALSIRPEDFETHLALGQCLAASGDRAGAEASLNTAKQLRPDDPRPDQELAKLKGK
jgi:tetratricopeptide (TPR) repeat protein